MTSPEACMPTGGNTKRLSSDSNPYTSRLPRLIILGLQNLYFQTLHPANLQQRPQPFRRIRIRNLDPPPSSLYIYFQRAQRPHIYSLPLPRALSMHYSPFFIMYAPDRGLRFIAIHPPDFQSPIILPKYAAKRGFRAASGLRMV